MARFGLNEKITSTLPFVVLLSLSITLVVVPWAIFGWLSQEESGDHGHGHGDEHGEEMSIEEFHQMAHQFIEAHLLPDGSIQLRSGESVLYIVAHQWIYEPSIIRLQVGVEYQVKMVSMDVIHGASINTPSGSRMVRLPPREIVELTLTFDEIGQYALYCSYYCGIGHPSMNATIIVEA